jgi:hypothetical protein
MDRLRAAGDPFLEEAGLGPGGRDRPEFQFALDWDLLARFHIAGCKVVRVPYFLGCFRVHAEQKTSQDIHTTGADEMSRVRLRFHGPDKDHAAMIERHAAGSASGAPSRPGSWRPASAGRSLFFDVNSEASPFPKE